MHSIDSQKNFLSNLEKAGFMELSKKFLRFILGGGVIWGFRAGLTVLLVEKTGMSPDTAYRIGLALSFFCYFFMNLHFVFLVKDRIWWRMAKFSCVSISFLTMDGLLMAYLHQQWGWHYLLALSTSTATLLCVKFVLYNFFVFQQEKPT